MIARAISLGTSIAYQALPIITPIAADYAVYRIFEATLLPKERYQLSGAMGFFTWAVIILKSQANRFEVAYFATIAYAIYKIAISIWSSKFLPRYSWLSSLSGEQTLESVQARDTLIFWSALSREIGLPINLSKTVTFTQAAEKEKEFPQWLQAHKKLIQRITELGLSYSNLTTLSKEIGILENLTSLDLTKNQLSSLPEELGQLKKLQYLYLDDNKFTKFPKIICQLKMLKSLMLFGNPLEWIPKKIKLLQELENLQLGHCSIYELPSIAELKKLKNLWIHSNNLLTLPSDLPSSLRIINASNNRIPHRVVQRFQNLPNLTIDFSRQQPEEPQLT